jgi:ferrous iron transport protein B
VRTILLAGNPNSGKSTLFNALTGAHQHVGNWPGKTVEIREGAWHVGGLQLRVIDLPGSYSLNAHTPEEAIARDAILTSGADLVVVTADAANLERNLYLVVQILEMNVPVLLVLNMWDAACTAGIHIDIGGLSSRLGVPVVRTTLSKGEGLADLQRLALEALELAGAQPC